MPEYRKHPPGIPLCRERHGKERKVMEMFSQELRELDRNTVQYMMDEMQAEIDRKRETIGQQQSTIDQQKDTIGQQQNTIDQQKHLLEEKEQALSASLEEIRRLKAMLKEPMNQ